MTKIISLSLTPEATGRLHDVIACFAKFGETLSLEATNDKLSLVTLNISKTAYASCTFDAYSFCSSYLFTPQIPGSDGKFSCQVLNRALLSAIRTRVQDSRGKDTAIERCDISVEESETSTVCRIIVKVVCRHGVTKIYKLTYHATQVMHALFDKEAAVNRWQISSRALRDCVEYFGPRTESLSMDTKSGKAIFTSFTEKIMDGKEILKQPLETAIAINTDDFDIYHAEEDLQIIISVKDFRAIVAHAETLSSDVSAYFSRPGRPLQISYNAHGVTVAYVLMTTGSYSGSATGSTTTSRQVSVQRGTSAIPVLQETSATARSETADEPPMLTHSMAPPPPPRRQQPAAGLSGSQAQAQSTQSQTQTQTQRRRLPALQKSAVSVAPPAGPDDEPLFVSNDEEDRVWDAANLDDGQEEDELAWDAMGDMTQGRPAVRDLASQSAAYSIRHTNESLPSQGIPPTQRLSQMNGLFD